MKKKKTLNNEEQLDFAYLLELMPPLHSISEYGLLPELFSIVGHESFLKLCKYAGSETIKIPTLSELYRSMKALQIFYNVYIKKSGELVPYEYVDLVDKIWKVYFKDDFKST